MRVTDQINREGLCGSRRATDDEVREALQYSCVVQEIARQIRFLRELHRGDKDIGK